MNVFRKKNKAAKQLQQQHPQQHQQQQFDSFAFLDNPSNFADSEPRQLKTFRRKKNQEDSKPAFTLDDVLPQEDNFRTSLMMPQLSARFSMLREQDDPTTKIGKASDDSVLFPKRASRLNLFGHSALTDIAEVESQRGSIQPPFLAGSRPYSIPDGYASDDGGSVMARSRPVERPVEGNHLFSSRPKVYKTATTPSSARSPIGPERIGASKPFLESNAPLANTVSYKLRTGDDRDKDHHGDRTANFRVSGNGDSEISYTPSTPHSKNRTTTSSSLSGSYDIRSSTAATSIVEESPLLHQSSVKSYGYSAKSRTSEEENGSKRKAYGEFPDVGSGKDSTRPPLSKSSSSKSGRSQPRNVVSRNDNFSRPGPFSPSSTKMASSPATSNAQAMASLDFGLSHDGVSEDHQTQRYQTSPPTNRSAGREEESACNANAQPNNCVKETTIGLPARSAQPVDEQQNLQRQHQMQAGKVQRKRSSSTSSEGDSGSRASTEPTPPSAHVQTFSSPLSTTRDIKHNLSEVPPMPPSPSVSATHRYVQADKSKFTSRPRNHSAASTTSNTAANVKARVESLIRRQNAELASIEAKRDVPRPLQPNRNPSNHFQNPASNGTFFNTFDGSDEDTDDNPPQTKHNRPHPLAPADVHPALRQGVNKFVFDAEQPPSSHPSRHPDTLSVTSVYPADIDPFRNGQNPSDSPILAPVSGLGLSGMIRTHLRNDSDRSSYHATSDRHSQTWPINVRGVSASSTINQSKGQRSDPFELDHTALSPKMIQVEQRSSSISGPTMSRLQQGPGLHSSHRRTGSKAQQVLGSDAPEAGDPTTEHQGWQDDISSHRRGASTETQKEREDFENELAERRRRILERVADNERVGTPMVGKNERNARDNGVKPTNNRFNDNQTKALRMLGLGGGQREEKTIKPQKVGMLSNHGRENVSQVSPWAQLPPPVVAENPVTQTRKASATEAISRPRTPADDGRRTPADTRPMASGNPTAIDHSGRSRQRSATTTSRGRANSAAAERSKSSLGRHVDDEPFPPLDVLNRYSPESNNHRYAAEPSEPRFERSASAMSGRSRSLSRGEPTYYDAGTPPLHTMPIGPPRPSPKPPVGQSPVSAFAQQVGSPSLSGVSNTSMTSPGSSNTQQIPERQLISSGSRKKSVNKTMISEPKFVSSTSAVPLIGLPSGTSRPGPIMSPPVPSMNPRRYADSPYGVNTQPYDPTSRPPVYNQSTFAIAAAQRAYVEPQKYVSRHRNKLRKSSSEGGSLASKARQQAIAMEMDRERHHSPAVAVFPNRSATSLGTARPQYGGMI